MLTQPRPAPTGTPTETSHRAPNWIALSLGACTLYGLCLIVLIHTTADGSWFWYAQALAHGQHLYRDLHLPLQPIYPMELAALQRLLGTSWIAQQAVSLVHLALFLTSLALMTRQNHTAAWQRALLLTGTFVTCMAFIMMRFDDFHVLATSLQLFAALLLLRYAHQRLRLQRALALFALGIVCGLCLLTRINDGGMLLLATLAAACGIATSPARRVEAAVILPTVATLTILIVLAVLGETPRDWWWYSLHTAAAIKGGTGHLWTYPLRLPLGTLRELTRDWRFLLVTGYVLALGALAAWLTTNTTGIDPSQTETAPDKEGPTGKAIPTQVVLSTRHTHVIESTAPTRDTESTTPTRDTERAARTHATESTDPSCDTERAAPTRVILSAAKDLLLQTRVRSTSPNRPTPAPSSRPERSAAEKPAGPTARAKHEPTSRKAAITAAVLATLALHRNITHGNVARVLVAFAVLGIYVIALVTLVRWLQKRPNFRSTELLILLPLAQLISISLSAARWYPNTNPPAALFLVLLPVATPWVLRTPSARAVFFTWIALLTFSAGIDKLRNPFDWFNYRAGSFNAPRVWYPHPAYGPTLIEASQLHLIEPACRAIHAQSAAPELLSLPFTWPNYFCAVPPWHGYTQTFYDTSSAQTIATLAHELQNAPPEWIVYQRQLDVLARNEEAFNDAKPLPHRALDTFITQQLATHHWSATQLPSPPHDTSTWLLIHTQSAKERSQMQGFSNRP